MILVYFLKGKENTILNSFHSFRSLFHILVIKFVIFSTDFKNELFFLYFILYEFNVRLERYLILISLFLTNLSNFSKHHARYFFLPLILLSFSALIKVVHNCELIIVYFGGDSYILL